MLISFALFTSTLHAAAAAPVYFRVLFYWASLMEDRPASTRGGCKSRVTHSYQIHCERQTAVGLSQVASRRSPPCIRPRWTFLLACALTHARTHARVFRCASTRWNTRVTDSEGSSIRPRWTLPHAGLHGTHLDSHNSFVYEPVVSLPPPPSCDVLHLITCWKMGNVLRGMFRSLF